MGNWRSFVPARAGWLLAATAWALTACGGGGGGGGGSPPPSGGGGNPPPAAPVDFRDEVVYQLLTDRFLNGDASNDSLGGRPADTLNLTNPNGWHGGDFAGIRQKIQEGYFQRMGFTALWISPVVVQVPPPGNGGGPNAAWPFAGYHGYWAERFDQLEPHFGDAAALRALGQAADAAGLKLIIDVVVNHAGYNSTLVGVNPAWFRTGAQCGSDDRTMCLAGLPDFRQDVTPAADYLLNSIRFLRDSVAVDGLRMDTMKHVDDAFWTRFFAAGSPADPAVLWTVGEVFTADVAQVARYVDTLGSPSAFDFPLKFALTSSLARGGPVRLLADLFAQDTSYRDPTKLSTFLDNHDVARFASESEAAGIAPAEADQRLGMALATLYFARGIPFVYYGTEIAMRGEGDSYDRPLGRTSREDMDFTRLDASTLDERLRALADARRSYPALRRGAQRTLFAPGTACQPPATTLDPAADFGDRLYMRGSFDGWLQPPPQSRLFTNQGGRQYQAAFELAPGNYEFKVAAADWTPEFSNAGARIVPGAPLTLAPSAGLGNTLLAIAAAGCYVLELNAASATNPVLTVTQRSAGADPEVFVFARTLAGARTVVAVVNNQRTSADLATLAGGGVSVAGLLADGALVEVTGAAHALSVAGGRLIGSVPPLTTLAVANP